MTIGELVEKQTQRYPEKIFLYWQDDTVTFAQVNDLTNKVAHMLYDLGIRKGDVVSVLLPNMPEYVYLYLGIPKLGAIVGPVNALFKAREIQFVVGHSEAKILITIPRFMEIVNTIRKDLPCLEHVIVIGEPTDGALNYHELMEKAIATTSPKVSIDEKGRITIPQELRKKLGLTAGVELNLSIIRDFILIKKVLSAKEFEKLSDNISESLRQETDSPIKFEKLF